MYVNFDHVIYYHFNWKIVNVNNILAFFNIFNHDLLILVTLKLYNTVFFINSTVLKFYFFTVLVILLDP